VFLGLNVDVVDLSSTPLDMLVTLLVLAAIAAFALFLFTYIGAPFVDKRWPADEPLNPVEMLWGESGGYIQRTFRGLDLDMSKDLASQFVEKKFDQGSNIVEQGEPATHFYVIKDGEVEVSQRLEGGAMVREDVINRMGPGESFGETAILRRTARTATVRALTPVTVLELTAEDFVAGAAFSAAEDNELLARVDTYMQSDAERARSAREATGVGFLNRDNAPAAASAAVAAAGAEAGTAPPWHATHVVPAGGLSAWTEPDPDQQATTQLAAGVEVELREERGSWARVAAENGWEGWVDGRALEPFDG
jgi:CRP-like cAMP-binding protein